jgi:hypothetical protein
LGPQDFWAFALLAAICLGVAIFLVSSFFIGQCSAAARDDQSDAAIIWRDPRVSDGGLSYTAHQR